MAGTSCLKARVDVKIGEGFFTRRPAGGGLAELMDAGTSRELLRTASSHIVIINPAAPMPPAAQLHAEPAAAAS